MRTQILTFFFLLLANAAVAHDFWIEPSTFRPAVGSTVTASLRVGQHFMGDPVARSRQLIDAFVVRDGGGIRPVGGLEGRDPAGFVRVTAPGSVMLGYCSTANALELSAEKFAMFLREEELDAVIADRLGRGEENKPDREKFYRYAKSMVVAGNGASRGFDQPLGFRFEIIPESDPAKGRNLQLRLLLNGRPRAGLRVVAIHRDDPEIRATVRTDRNGRVVIALPRTGVWLVKSVYMIRAAPDAGYEWESLWASLTFER